MQTPHTVDISRDGVARHKARVAALTRLLNSEDPADAERRAQVIALLGSVHDAPPTAPE